MMRIRINVFYSSNEHLTQNKFIKKRLLKISKTANSFKLPEHKHQRDDDMNHNNNENKNKIKCSLFVFLYIYIYIQRRDYAFG